MNTVTKAALAAALSLGVSQFAIAAPAAPAPAAAAPAAAVAPGIGVANLEAIKANSNAVKLADQQRQTTYKATIDQARTRAQAIDAQLKGLAAKIDADRKAPKPNAALIDQEIAQAQALQQQGQQEVNKILEPVALSQSYVDEQVNAQLGPAISQTMAEQGVSLLLQPQAVLVATNKVYDLNVAILTKLNALIPAAQLVPPAGWEPLEVRQAKAQQAAAQGTAPLAPVAPAPAGTAAKPSGR